MGSSPPAARVLAGVARMVIGSLRAPFNSSAGMVSCPARSGLRVTCHSVQRSMRPMLAESPLLEFSLSIEKFLASTRKSGGESLLSSSRTVSVKESPTSTLLRSTWACRLGAACADVVNIKVANASAENSSAQQRRRKYGIRWLYGKCDVLILPTLFSRLSKALPLPERAILFACIAAPALPVFVIEFAPQQAGGVIRNL